MKSKIWDKNEKFISEYDQKVHERDFFNIIRVRFEKSVSGVRKKLKKLAFEISFWIKNLKANFFLKNFVFTALEFFFVYNKAMCKEKFFKLVIV